MSQLARRVGSFFLDIIETLVIAMSIFLVVYLFFLQPHQVNGQSMVPTFQNGDYLLTDKVSYRFGDPQRGDIVVFHAPPAANCAKGTGCDFIKRVIGLPGETVKIQSSQIMVDNQPLQEQYIPAEYVTEAEAYLKRVGVVTLDANEYFVVGDNRPYSSDSRAWGPITKSDIVGRAFFRYWPAQVSGFVKEVTY